MPLELGPPLVQALASPDTPRWSRLAILVIREFELLTRGAFGFCRTFAPKILASFLEFQRGHVVRSWGIDASSNHEQRLQFFC